MQRKTIHWLGVLIIMLGLASLACNALSGGDESAAVESESVAAEVEESAPEPEAEATEVPAEAEPETQPAEEEAATVEEEPVEEAEAAEAEEAAEAAEGQAKTLAVSSIPDLDDVTSYRMLIDASLSSNDDTGAETTQAFTIDVAVSNDPEGMSMTMSAEGLEGSEEFSGMAMTQVDGVSYMSVPELGCISTSEADSFGEDDPFAELTDTSAFMEDIGDANFEGEEVVNGIETLHYSFDETSFVTPGEEVEWAEGHIYVAKEGGYLVRMSMEGEGFFDEVSDVPQYGTIDLQIDIMDINQPVELIIPADCEGEGAGGTDWPVTEDAFNISSLGGFLTYQTEMPFEDVVAFYQEALTADGWQESEEESFIMEDTAIITFYRGDEILNLSVVQDDTEEDVLSVLIVSE